MCDLQDKLRTQITANSDTYTFDGFILVSQLQLDQVCRLTPSYLLQHFACHELLLVFVQVPSLYFQQYGHNYQMKLEPMGESIAVCYEQFKYVSLFLSLLHTQLFTVMDALLLEEYFFNHLFQLYDFAYGKSTIQ